MSRMIERWVQRKSPIDSDRGMWRKSDIIVSRMALLGVIKVNFDFSKAMMDDCKVGSESFATGLLLFKS